MACVPRPAGESRFAWGVILLLALPLAVYGQMGWRFWTAADGMAESYSQSVGIAPDGTAWIRHGQVSAMSVLNGYSVSQIAEPRATREVNWGLLARVHGGSPGEAWTIEDGVLKRYVNQHWTGCDAPPWRDAMLAAIPMGRGRVWVLFRDRMAEYQAGSKSWTAVKNSSATSIGQFSTMVRGLGADVWVAGGHGAGRLEIGGDSGGKGESRAGPNATRAGWACVKSSGSCPANTVTCSSSVPPPRATLGWWPGGRNRVWRWSPRRRRWSMPGGAWKTASGCWNAPRCATSPRGTSSGSTGAVR